MWILIAEMLLALGVILFIFWWTMRARIDHPVQQVELDESSEDSKPKSPDPEKDFKRS